MSTRKIIHVDMDCFYAAIEVRDNPHLRGKPVAVGGAANQRGVLCTCNYEARQFGLHSAMASAYALRLCPDLVLLPVDMPKYKAVSAGIQALFFEYSEQVEPLSLDEAFLDVTESDRHQGSASRIANEICARIYHEFALTASAGISYNKFLAKLASGWNKPNGQFLIAPEQASEFIKTVPVKNIFGVGRVTAKKLDALNIQCCGDLQLKSREWLTQHFGVFGSQLYLLCRGEDERPVEPHRMRKSLSVENTFIQDIADFAQLEMALSNLFNELNRRLSRVDLPLQQQIKTLSLKLKLDDFSVTSVQCTANSFCIASYQALLTKKLRSVTKKVRLLGIGVQFDDAHSATNNSVSQQLSLSL